ncbi:MAG: hypothetical protein LC104_12220 [Bacteroidales bacterium]|nr:hypothetical protein [Bacteroidales bacterium]
MILPTHNLSVSPSPRAPNLPTDHTLTLGHLYSLFPDRTDEPHALEPIRGDQMPEPYHGLLVHSHHMTVTVEQFYGQPVNVQVVESYHAGDDYARKSLLSLRDSGKIVQFGIVRIDLNLLAPLVRQQIEEEQTPLGRVLIQNNVLRIVQPVGYFRITLAPKMAEWFGLSGPETTYGRVGVIHTDGRPAIRVGEILTPVKMAGE